MKKSDFFLIGILLLVCAVMLCFSFAGKKEGGTVSISVDGEQVAVLSLDQDTEYIVENEYGRNVVAVSGGKVCMLTADCPDGICSRSSPIYRTGESIVCLPHKLSVTIISSQYGQEIDAVTK